MGHLQPGEPWFRVQHCVHGGDGTCCRCVKCNGNALVREGRDGSRRGPKHAVHGYHGAHCCLQVLMKESCERAEEGGVGTCQQQLRMSHTCRNTPTYTHTPTHAHTHAYTSIHMHTCIHAHTCTCTRTHTHAHAHMLTLRQTWLMAAEKRGPVVGWYGSMSRRESCDKGPEAR